MRFNCTSYAVQAIRKSLNVDSTWLIAPSKEMGLIYEPLNQNFFTAMNQNFFTAMLVPLLDAGEAWVSAVTARQALFVKRPRFC